MHSHALPSCRSSMLLRQNVRAAISCRMRFHPDVTRNEPNRLKPEACTPIIDFSHGTTSATMNQWTITGLVALLVGIKIPLIALAFESCSPTHHSASASPIRTSK